MSCPMIKLNNGKEIPQLGFGVYQIKPEDTKRCVLEALKVGYRHIDTAHYYENERQVGEAIKEFLENNKEVKREDIWVTSKVWVTEFGKGKTRSAVGKMLKRLGLEYIDLVLIHYPYNDYMGAYKELEEEVEAGHIKSIGISNFEDSKFEDLYNKVKIKPVLNQIELHPYFQQREIREKMNAKDVKTEGWAPLAQATTYLFKEKIIVKLAQKYQKTEAQIVLRWHIQSGFITIPKSCNPKRIKENFEIFDFELAQDEMEQINSLNGKRGRVQYNSFILYFGLWFMPAPKD
jgi:diketogulonate reductase-like aldo/keto reductase